MEKLRTLNKKLWNFLKIFVFLSYGIVCLTEGIKLYHRYIQDEPIPHWSIYLFLSVAILIPGLLGFAIKNKGAGTRFFVGTGRVVVSIALLIACILSQRGLEREKGVVVEAPPVAPQTLQSPQSKEVDVGLAVKESSEIRKPETVDTTPPTFMECVFNGKKYYSNLPFEIVKKEIQDRCLRSIFAFGSEKL